MAEHSIGVETQKGDFRGETKGLFRLVVDGGHDLMINLSEPQVREILGEMPGNIIVFQRSDRRAQKLFKAFATESAESVHIA